MPEVPEPQLNLHPWEAAKRHLDPPPSTAGGTKCRSMPPGSLDYAELHVTTNFTFLTGASHPEEFVQQAAQLGHPAIGITDINTLAGIVRAHIAAKKVGIRSIVGCRLELQCPVDATEEEMWPSESFEREPSHSHPVPLPEASSLRRRACPPWRVAPSLPILTYPTDRNSYGQLCRLLTLGKRRAPKGQCHLRLHDLLNYSDGLLAVIVPPRDIDENFLDVIHGLRDVFDDDRLSIAAACTYGPDDRGRLTQLAALSKHTDVPLVATNDAHYHIPQRRPLQDVLTCIRLGRTLADAALDLHPNAERHLKSPDHMARLFADQPRAIARSVQIATRAAGFNLDQLKYDYPDETCPPGTPPIAYLTQLAHHGAQQRYPEGVPEKVQRQITYELNLIDELNYAPYFLTVHDLVKFARSRRILCQGRGAAANSAVCYCLGVTAVDPDRIDVLFERFISKQRNEPPDIDIDFEHERREEVIQYIYGKYGRDRAALTAEVITYRGRSAVREIGKSLGLSLDCVDRLAKSLDWWHQGLVKPQQLRKHGIQPDDPTIRHLMRLTKQILGFPRHLSQHVGGFVITRSSLCELVPIENATMENRTVIEWDKNDIDAMGMLKVDVLGLGMLTCIRKCLEMVNEEAMEGEEATKRPSDEAMEEKHLYKQLDHGQGQIAKQQSAHFSGSDCVAASDGISESCIQGDGGNATLGAFRLDRPDQTGWDLDSIEYRGRTRPSEPSGLSQTSSNCVRLASRTLDSTQTGHQSTAAQAPSGPQEPARRRGSHPPSLNPKPAEITSSPSSLRRSVASSPSPSPSPPPLQLHSIPSEDPAVYDMICQADTIGVFQIESRAQMSMLPRLRPRCYYDLVIEVAIVRPGPIQGNMVHPYLRRRNGDEPVTYPDEKVKQVLGKTLGVPLFQEQAMALSIVAAGFTPGEADQLRRAIAAWKSKQKAIYQFGQKIIQGMVSHGYPREFAEQCFKQIKGFSEYGFPESHAASFALLVYVSAWLKKYHPGVFAAALINSQPMGFYAPAQIVRDAREHGVEVRPVDVHHSTWDCTLERESDPNGAGFAIRHGVQAPRRSDGGNGPALRLGMRLVKGLAKSEVAAIRGAVLDQGPFRSIEQLWRASGVKVASLRRLAVADAFGSMDLDRQAALWQLCSLHDRKLPIFEQLEPASEPVALPTICKLQQVQHDYANLGLSLRAHPISFIRPALTRRGVTPNTELKDPQRWPNGKSIAVAGLVLVRQRPGTASGVVFETLEDETAIANLILGPKVFERYHKAARHGTAIIASGKVERQGQVVHVMVQRVKDVSGELQDLIARSRDFH